MKTHKISAISSTLIFQYFQGFPLCSEKHVMCTFYKQRGNLRNDGKWKLSDLAEILWVLTRLNIETLMKIFDVYDLFAVIASLWNTVSDAVNFHFKHCGRAPRGVKGVKRSKLSCQIRFWQFEALIFSQNWKNAKNAKNDLKTSVFDHILEVYSISVES